MTATGPNLKHLVIGSEGVLGIITRATMKVHRVPAVQVFEGMDRERERESRENEMRSREIQSERERQRRELHRSGPAVKREDDAETEVKRERERERSGAPDPLRGTAGVEIEPTGVAMVTDTHMSSMSPYLSLCIPDEHVASQPPGGNERGEV